LADNNIFTAADVEEYMIRRIKGFGDVLTANVLMWKEGVLRQFRFNAAMAVSAAEQRVVGEMERLAHACQVALQQMVPDLRRAVAEYDQAEADLEMFAGR
jgi:DNA-binding helix-hairpin-helix protein with protein kinase domain